MILGPRRLDLRPIERHRRLGPDRRGRRSALGRSFFGVWVANCVELNANVTRGDMSPTTEERMTVKMAADQRGRTEARSMPKGEGPLPAERSLRLFTGNANRPLAEAICK